LQAVRLAALLQLTPHVRGGARTTDDSDLLRRLVRFSGQDRPACLDSGGGAIVHGIRARSSCKDPVIGSNHFDLVVVPRHDELHGDNIISTQGALHRITPELLRKDAERLKPEIARLTRPYVSVLIGGSNAAYRLGPTEMTRLACQLVSVARDLKASLLVTPSRRTDEECLTILKAELAPVPHYLWDMRGENPYFGLLGLADFIVVTGDSVNMVSESASTGKPVYVVDLPGGSAKFERFHRALRDDGVTRVFAGKLEPYSYTPLDDVGAVAARVEALLRP
jgi:mitochondrial fission protein ELM1